MLELEPEHRRAEGCEGSQSLERHTSPRRYDATPVTRASRGGQKNTLPAPKA